MDQKRIRLVLFSTWGSDYQQFEFSVSAFLSVLATFGAVVVLLSGGLIYASKVAFQQVYVRMQEERLSLLQQQFKNWKERADDLSLRYERLQGFPLTRSYTSVEEKQPPQSMESLTGRGGAFIDEEDNILPTLESSGGVPDGNLYRNELRPLSDDYERLETSDLINELESRLSTTRQVYRVIFEEFEKRRQQLEHVPSIKPILSGRVTDFFGKRVDPFVRRIRHHRGLDVAAPHGTEVYAPAAGTVELAKTQYRTNRGYGRVVIINHGHGMKTLYGHLSKVSVKTGQRIERWDVLGTVGDTGRATGPHLHYEVWVDGKARDPVEFIINE